MSVYYQLFEKIEKFVGLYDTVFLPERTVTFYYVVLKYRTYLDQSPAPKSLITLCNFFFMYW